VASFLNLLNDDSLLRPAGWVEACVLIASGLLLGGGLCRLRLPNAFGSAIGIAFLASLAAISMSYFTSFWFPWLVIVGGQVPCALAWALVVNARRRPATETQGTVSEPAPETPGYELIHPPFGEGAYGKVWLARTKAGEWRALKVIYLAKFDGDADPYEREFNGVQKYQLVSGRHPGLLRVDFVSEKRRDHFYYVMELGDALEPGWENDPSAYQPRDLVSERAKLPKGRLPIKECLRVGIRLCEVHQTL